MEPLDVLREAMDSITLTTVFGTGSLAWRTLAYAGRELEARFGDDADLLRFLDDLETATTAARERIASLTATPSPPL